MTVLHPEPPGPTPVPPPELMQLNANPTTITTSGGSSTITAVIAAGSHTISSVDLYTGSTKVGEMTLSSGDYVYTVTPSETTTYTVKITYDEDETVSPSTSVTVTVNIPITPPTLTSLTANKLLSDGSDITITAVIVAGSNTIDKVEIYNSSGKMGDMTAGSGNEYTYTIPYPSEIAAPVALTDIYVKILYNDDETLTPSTKIDSLDFCVAFEGYHVVAKTPTIIPGETGSEISLANWNLFEGCWKGTTGSPYKGYDPSTNALKNIQTQGYRIITISGDESTAIHNQTEWTTKMSVRPYIYEQDNFYVVGTNHTIEIDNIIYIPVPMDVVMGDKTDPTSNAGKYQEYIKTLYFSIPSATRPEIYSIIPNSQNPVLITDANFDDIFALVWQSSTIYMKLSDFPQLFN